MSFPNRRLADMKTVNTDGTTTYVNSTNSIIYFKSMVSEVEVEFKGFITEMSDKFQSNWDSETVYGRMDPIGTFKNTQRTISLGWTIPAADLEEAKSNAVAVKSLTSMLYPGYATNPTNVKGIDTFTTSNSLSKPPLIRLKYANLIDSVGDEKGLLGWVDGFDITPTIDMGFFINGKDHYAKVYTMSCTFNVLHEHDLGFNSSKEWIANGNDGLKKFPFTGGSTDE